MSGKTFIIQQVLSAKELHGAIVNDRKTFLAGFVGGVGLELVRALDLSEVSESDRDITVRVEINMEFRSRGW